MSCFRLPKLIIQQRTSAVAHFDGVQRSRKMFALALIEEDVLEQIGGRNGFLDYR